MSFPLPLRGRQWKSISEIIYPFKGLVFFAFRPLDGRQKSNTLRPLRLYGEQEEGKKDARH